ncbi:putative F-box protein [Platanthera zijinensis]|uniref:F-box protein n=1 Tax=Platanthera zijinensis TaxID=2320716 RepID=A0AAP0B323_9ASPA
MEKKRAAMMETAELRKKRAQEKVGVHIPGDIISEILLRLPARILGKFRCVSKSWLSITTNTVFVRANAQHNLITRPSLIIGDRQPYLASANAASVFPIRLQPMETMSENYFVMASCDGLVCARSLQDSQHFISNPLTGQSIALPLDNIYLTCKLGFYFHRSTSKYRLIRFKVPMTHESEVLVVGERSWRSIPVSIPAFFDCECPLELSGKLYWLAHTRRKIICKLPPDIIVIFDEEEEVYSAICPPPTKKLQKYLGGNLVNFNGELGLWVVGLNVTIDLWIMDTFWIKRYSVNYACIHKCPSPFKIKARSRPWILGGAISIRDEELLVHLSTIIAPHSLARWNLKSGACVLQHLVYKSSTFRSTFPYTETLTNPQ